MPLELGPIPPDLQPVAPFGGSIICLPGSWGSRPRLTIFRRSAACACAAFLFPGSRTATGLDAVGTGTNPPGLTTCRPLWGFYYLSSWFLGLAPQANHLSPLRGFSPGDEMDLPQCHPEGAKRVEGSVGNSTDPHPTHRLVLSEAEGRVEWIPPLARVARSVGMTRWGPHLPLARYDVSGLTGDEPLQRRRRDRYLARGVSPGAGELNTNEPPGGGDRCIAWGVSPRNEETK